MYPSEKYESVGIMKFPRYGKMMEFVSWDGLKFPTEWNFIKHVPNMSKPPTRYVASGIL